MKNLDDKSCRIALDKDYGHYLRAILCLYRPDFPQNRVQLIFLGLPMIYTTLISAYQLEQQQNNADWVIFDCRFSLEQSESGAKAYRMDHIANARYVHLNKDLSSSNTDKS